DRANMPTALRNCIHCHQVRENILRTRWQEKKLTYDDIWTYPLPDNAGVTIELDDGLRVQSVKPDSPADKAGIPAGDELLTLNGQRLISPADIQWVLHHATGDAKIPVTFRRGGATLSKTLALNGSWRETDLTWRASSWGGLRLGLQTIPLADAE